MRLTRKAFSLIELPVVITIIVVMLALIAPALNQAMQTTQVMFCAANEHTIGTAITASLMDHKQVFPQIPNAGTLLGNLGASEQYNSTKYNEQHRPLNKYLGYVSGPVRVARCPSDRGDVLSFDQLFQADSDSPSTYTQTSNCYTGYGTSYQEAFGKSRWKVKPVFGKVGTANPSMKSTHIRRPENKIVLADWPFYGDRRIDSELTSWHTLKERQLNVLFADMHSEFFLFPNHEMENPCNADQDGDPSFYWW